MHGAPDAPVVVGTRLGDGFELSVTNQGEPIPPEMVKDRSSKEGPGLGLYIPAEMARAHNGTLSVDSSAAETRFTFRIPVD